MLSFRLHQLLKTNHDECAKVLVQVLKLRLFHTESYPWYTTATTACSTIFGHHMRILHFTTFVPFTVCMSRDIATESIVMIVSCFLLPNGRNLFNQRINRIIFATTDARMINNLLYCIFETGSSPYKIVVCIVEAI